MTEKMVRGVEEDRQVRMDKMERMAFKDHQDRMDKMEKLALQDHSERMEKMERTGHQDHSEKMDPKDHLEKTERVESIIYGITVLFINNGNIPYNLPDTITTIFITSTDINEIDFVPNNVRELYIYNKNICSDKCERDGLIIIK